MARARLPRGSSKAGKHAAGRPTLDRTPLTIRSHQPLGAGFQERIQRQVARRLEHAAGLIERVTVRFEDVNGPKGGVDIICRIKAVLSSRPSLVIEKQAQDESQAFSAAFNALGTALKREQGKHALHTGPRRGKPMAARGAAPMREQGELIGRRVGRGQAALSRALRRPEKRNRAHYVDTAEAGASASDRRAGGPYSARRNTMARTTRATAMLEDSRTTPSRKSSRRSANRGKPSQTKERAAAQKLQTPRSRAMRGA